ncbi:hypothetical protein HFD88_002220 [Aspergillus terreus]|uniref:CorA-like transporter domain-containing protein n=1 Tax=Aspergillus terreus var. terreus TaxID=2081996 RepID=A0A7D7QDP1_ASPTE|nr:hypothetical protein HFD88_002220 [Aspergillus terreus]QMS79055.1 putative protein unc-13 C [Aspergillus terreus var. terreus]
MIESTPALPASYPFDPFSLAAYPQDYWARAESRKCFQADKSKVEVNWTEVDSQRRVTRKRITTLAELSTYTNQNPPARDGLRIIGIPQGNSWRPLKITPDMLSNIIDSTRASPEILELFLSFCQRTLPVEEAFSGAPFVRWNKDNNSVLEIAYVFKYAFQKPTEDGVSSWVLRTTGVYQKYDQKTKSSTWIFMHPTTDCPFQRRLTDALVSTDQYARLMEHPLLMHNILFATYFPNWRDYLAYNQARVLPVSPVTGLVNRTHGSLDDNHRNLAAVRSVEYSCAPLQAIFRSTREIFDKMHLANQFLEDHGQAGQPKTEAMRQLLDNYLNHVDAYSQSALFLQGQTARAAQLLSDAISFKISITTQAQTDYMLDLTVSTSDDSMTVRVITIVTLIYLPSTFMAVSSNTPGDGLPSGGKVSI